VQGSICKYLLGNNAESLTRHDTERVIESLSDVLGLPMASAMVYRLDIGANLLMKYPLISYMALLGEAPYLKKSFEADRQTVQYSNQRRAILLYDKIAEMKRHREPVPAQVQGKNLLRVEYRFLKKSAKQLGKKEIKAADLYKDGFYIKPIDKLEEQYFLIQKLRRGGALSMKGQKDIVNSLAFLGLQAIGGQDTALGLLQAENERGRLSKSQYYRGMEKVKKIACLKLDTSGCDEIQELDLKIKQAVAFYR
jgi:hypothetical protein